jgi:hypothetical protein
MKQQINEIKRMQQLAGLIKESQLNEDIDITYGREEGENDVDVDKAISFIKQTLKNRGYNVPEIILDDMYENGAIGDLFSTEDPNDPQLDYYETFNEEKAIEMTREYVDMMKQSNGELLALADEDYTHYTLPDNINSLEDFK